MNTKYGVPKLAFPTNVFNLRCALKVADLISGANLHPFLLVMSVGCFNVLLLKGLSSLINT